MTIDLKGEVIVQRITPCLWFADEAEEAARFYASVFRGSLVTDVVRRDSPEHRGHDNVISASFRVGGYEFVALNGAPVFSFTPAISFFVNCDTREEVDEVWKRLSTGGTVLMELGTYPFNEWYGWIQDKYGVSWQVWLAPGSVKITPCFLFVRDQHGRAEEAMSFYASHIEDSRISAIERNAPGQGEIEGTVMYGTFSLAGQDFVALDGGLGHAFTFTEAISLSVNCPSPDEASALTRNLASGGGSQGAMGRLKDKFGVSWRVTDAMSLRQDACR